MKTSDWKPPQQTLPEPYQHLELFQHLGKGGQGIVYAAESMRQMGRLLAIKFFRDAAWRNAPVLVEAFFQEADFGKSVRSHNLGHTLELLDLRRYVAEGWPPAALVMECYGCSLAQVLQGCNGTYRFPVAQVSRWARELVTGLADLHDRYRKVHRDVKPGNITFRLPPGQRYTGPESMYGAEAVLTDFGTIAGAGQHSPLILLHDKWKDPAFYPSNGDRQPPGNPPHRR